MPAVRRSYVSRRRQGAGGVPQSDVRNAGALVTQSAEDQDFQAQMARVQALTRQLERISDPAVRASVKELVQCMLEHMRSEGRNRDIGHAGPQRLP
jgi:hypothetical protein